MPACAVLSVLEVAEEQHAALDVLERQQPVLRI